jgi:PPM family protein phosphatase
VDVAVSESGLLVTVGAVTDVGGRPENEDALLVADLPPVGEGPGATEGGYLLAVADGMGGHQRGEVASKLAIETVRQAFDEDPGADPHTLLKQAFRKANSAIFQGGSAAGEANMMGTTLVVAATRGKYATIASIGDSRAYLVRANQLTQITQDHSLVAQQLADGQISEEEARSSPHRNILTHALGHRERLHSSMPNVFEIVLLPEDRLLLCSDGFYDVVENTDFLSLLVDGEPQEAAARLVALAKERGTADNVSAVVAKAVSTRVVTAPVPVPAGAERRPLLVPALVGLAVIIFVVLVVLILTVL